MRYFLVIGDFLSLSFIFRRVLNPFLVFVSLRLWLCVRSGVWGHRRSVGGVGAEMA